MPPTPTKAPAGTTDWNLVNPKTVVREAGHLQIIVSFDRCPSNDRVSAVAVHDDCGRRRLQAAVSRPELLAVQRSSQCLNLGLASDVRCIVVT